MNDQYLKKQENKKEEKKDTGIIGGKKQGENNVSLALSPPTCVRVSFSPSINLRSTLVSNYLLFEKQIGEFIFDLRSKLVCIYRKFRKVLRPISFVSFLVKKKARLANSLLINEDVTRKQNAGLANSS